MVVSSPYIKTVPDEMEVGKSLVYKANSVGRNTDPWGTPLVTFNADDDTGHEQMEY